MQPGMVIFSQAPWIGIDHLLKLRQPVLNFDNFIDLFLVCSNHKARAAMAQNIDHFFGNRIFIQRYRNRTNRLGRGHRPIHARAVVADNCDKIAFFNTQLQQAKRQSLNLFLHLGPRPCLPDAQFFFAVRWRVGQCRRIASQ